MGEDEDKVLPASPTAGIPLGSLQHAKNLLKLLYKKEGFAFDGMLGEATTKEFGDDIEATKFASMFCLLDEVITIYHNLNLAVIGSIAQKDERAPFEYRFSNSALNSLCAIRTLLGKGFDLEARVQLRAFREIMVAWLYFDRFPDKRTSFSEPKTLEEANHFWYTNLRKAERSLKEIAEAGSFHPHMDDKFIELERILNTAAHPSWVGLDASATANWRNPSDQITRHPISNASLFSLNAALALSIFGYAPLKPVRFSVPSGLAHLFPKRADSDDLNEVFEHLQKMPALIFLFGCRFVEQLTNQH